MPDGSLQQHYSESENRNGLYGKLDLTYTMPTRIADSGHTGTQWNIMAEVYSSPYAERGNYRSSCTFRQAGDWIPCKW